MSREAHRLLLERSRRRHGRIYSLVKGKGPISLSTRDTGLFESMARTVTGQQLSNTAARSIWSRVQAIVSRDGRSVQEFCCDDSIEELRACGLSGNKVRALINLRRAFADGEISDQQIRGADHRTIVELISSIWGFGEWSADMIAIFHCGLPDVWSWADSSLQKGLEILCEVGTDCSKVPPDFSPFRTYLALHIWRGLDDGRLRRRQ